MAKGGSPAIGLGFGVGTINHCNSNDNTFYCQFTRAFQMAIMTIILLYIAYFVYTMFLQKPIKNLFSSRGR